VNPAGKQGALISQLRGAKRKRLMDWFSSAIAGDAIWQMPIKQSALLCRVIIVLLLRRSAKFMYHQYYRHVVFTWFFSF